MNRYAVVVAIALCALATACKKDSPSATESSEPAAAKGGEVDNKVKAPPPEKQPDKPPVQTAEQTMPAVGDLAPDFTTVAHDGTEVKVSALRGEPFVLYFYPRDETPG